MCIIVAKDKNVDVPTIDILKRCFDYNSDGAGFMYVACKYNVCLMYVVCMFERL